MTNHEKVVAIEEILSARYQTSEYPSLRDQTARFAKTRPFEGRTLLDGTPLYTNTLAKYVPLLEGGASLAVSLCEGVPFDPAVRSILDRLEIPVYENGNVPDESFDIIMDCDGTRAATKPRVGVCELTRSGLYHYKEATVPVVLVDDSHIKEIETTLGTGNGFMRAMKHWGYCDWKGKKVVVFGYGKVGRGVSYACANEGALVTVVDRPSVKIDSSLLQRLVDFNQLSQVREVVADSDYLVTATGVRGAMRRYGFSDEDLKKPVIAAIGIEDEWLESLSRARQVNRGEAVNFSLDEPTLLRYIDPTMALANESAVDLLEGRISARGIHKPNSQSEARCLAPVKAAGLITQELIQMQL